MTTVTLIGYPTPNDGGQIYFHWNPDVRDSSVWIWSDKPRNVWGTKKCADGSLYVYDLSPLTQMVSARDAREVWTKLVGEGWTVKVEEDATR